MSPLKTEIAQLAATYIADHGLSYALAKQRAVSELLGRNRPRTDELPNTDELEAALLEHLQLFDAQAHALRLKSLRQAALAAMELLASFECLVAGAAWKGIATEQAFAHLLLFADNSKEVEAFLLDRNISYDLSELPDWRRAQGDSSKDSVPALVIHRGDTPVAIGLYPTEASRGALKPPLPDGRPARGNKKQLFDLLETED